jgi:hypothetical protein
MRIVGDQLFRAMASDQSHRIVTMDQMIMVSKTAGPIAKLDVS